MVNFVTANMIRTTDHPVVKQYMDIIQSSCVAAGYQCPDIVKPYKNIHKKDYVVTDSPLIAIQYMLKGFTKHIVWFQGVAPEESFMARKSHIRAAVLACIEKVVLKKAKVVLFVSKAMQEHYEKKYHLQLEHKSFIMPCFNELGIEESAFSEEKYRQNTFTYVGSLLAWQCFEETVKLYAAIEKQAKEPVEFCVYTFQQDEAKDILRKHGVQNYTVDCVPKEELSERIKKAKYGFIVREESVVNHVATPTKFSNYLANGIIPIYSSALRSFAEFDRGNKLGIVYDLDEPELGLERILEHMQQNISADQVRTKCDRAYATYYNPDFYRDALASKLKKILK